MRGVRAVGIATAMIALSGCSPNPPACPAIGWPSTAMIELADPRPGLMLELCAGQGCTPSPPSPGEPPHAQVAGTSDEGWVVSLVDPIEVLGYRVTDPAGVVVTEGYATLDWERIGGSEECGGPTEATLVI